MQKKKEIQALNKKTITISTIAWAHILQPSGFYKNTKKKERRAAIENKMIPAFFLSIF